MRRLLADLLLEKAKKNPDIYVLTGDLGYKLWDDFTVYCPSQYLNCGAAEQAMLDIAVGLAYEGKIPFVYSITPFLLYRGFETVRTYINYEKLNIKLLGSGRNHDYAHDGISHWSDDAGLVLASVPNIKSYWPKKKEEIPGILKEMLEVKGPCFISLKR